MQTGEAGFTIVPTQGQLIGQVILPALGAGKVKANQEVIVKLDDYRYMEYGTVTGHVNKKPNSPSLCYLLLKY